MEMSDTKMAAGNPPPYSGPPGPPGPPGPYGPPPQVVGVVTPATTTIIQAPASAIVVTQQMSPKEVNIVCKSCEAQIQTRVERTSAMKTHLFALLLCLFGCWPCVCIPYCMDSCKNADHYCPNCNAYIGSHIA